MLGTILLATSLASSAYDWWTSYQQGKRADEMQRNNVRPTMYIPESEQKSLASAEAQAKMTRLPGQSAIEGRLDQTTANQVAMLERMGTGGPASINGASRAYSMQQEKENELGIKSAEMRLHNQEILRNELDENAEWQQKAWDWNVGDPYLSKQAAISSLREAQLRNRNTAVKNLIGGLGNTAIMSSMGGDGWFSSKTGGSSNNGPGYDTPINIDQYQSNTSNTSGASDPMAGQTPEKFNYTDKMLSGWTWGGVN